MSAETARQRRDEGERILHVISRLWLMAALILLGSCGGGDGSSGIPAPSGLSYESPQAFVVGHEITTLLPTVTGTVSSYSIDPDLPAGLHLDSATGAISGTPIAAAPRETYTVHAANSTGSTTTGISITVDNDVAPDISYESSSFAFTTGVPVVGVEPSNGGGLVATWSIDSPLSAGLNFDTTNGSIRGTPSAVSGPTTHIVTAENSGGVSAFTVTITVESGVLLDLGHIGPMNSLRYVGSRVFGLELTGHWVLWDSQSATNLASGEARCDFPLCDEIPRADLAGGTIAIRTRDGFELRSSADGRLLSHIVATASWWKLATDGSYLCAGDEDGLKAWTPSGAVIFEKSGDYSESIAFASPDEIRVADGPAGSDALEVVSAALGSSSLSAPYQGNFHSWFPDGQRFLTSLGNFVWTYSKDAVLQDLGSYPTVENLAGQGNWIWTFSAGVLDLYAVGSGPSVDTSYNFSSPARLFSSGTTLGILPLSSGLAQIGVIDLSGPSPSRSDHASTLSYFSAYAAISASEWMVANDSGVLVDGPSLSGTPGYFSLGQARSIAGGTEHFAVATASGAILYFDALTKELEGRIEYPSSKIAISADGTVLAAQADQFNPYLADRSIKIFSLPSGALLHEWPYTAPGPFPTDFWLSASGEVLAQTWGSGDREVAPATGGALIWSDASGTPSTAGIPTLLSPSGALIAVASQEPDDDVGTAVFEGVALKTVVEGFGVGWLDDDRLLVNTYSFTGSNNVYSGCRIVDATGLELATPLLPELRNFQNVAPDLVYSPALNSILSITTAESVWTSANAAYSESGAVASGYVVFWSGAAVRAEPINGP